jgi:hypothetical protein
MLNQQVYTQVRVKDEGLERHGQIGVFVGPGGAPDESAVKFESAVPGGEQEIEHLKDDALEAV